MTGFVKQLLSDASAAKAVTVSATVHVVGLGLLAAALGTVAMKQPAPTGSIVLQLSIEQEDFDPETEFRVASSPVAEPASVLVTPRGSRIDDRWYRRVSSRVDLPDAEEQAEIDLLMADLDVVRNTDRSEATEDDEQSLDTAATRSPVPERVASATVPPTVPSELLKAEQPRRPAAKSVAVGYGDAPPKFTYQPSPVYPRTARTRGIEGTVLLRLEVEASGRVASVEVARSSGHPALDAAAVTTVRTWRCTARTRGGEPVASTETLPVHFRLR